MAKKKRKARGLPVVLKIVGFQTGKRKSPILDKKRRAMRPGKRRSKRGKIYYETRRNRSDLKGWL